MGANWLILCNRNIKMDSFYTQSKLDSHDIFFVRGISFPYVRYKLHQERLLPCEEWFVWQCRSNNSKHLPVLQSFLVFCGEMHVGMEA